MHYKCMVVAYVLLGIREAEINVAEGKKQARILSSEAYRLEQINQAKGIYLIILLYCCTVGRCVSSTAG